MWVYLVFAALLGIVAAVLLHWFTWWLRLHHRKWSVVLGALSALSVTAFGMIFIWPYPSDIAGLVQTALILFWAGVILIGLLQAYSIPAPWWAGVLGLFAETGLGFLVLSSVNLFLQWLAFGSGFRPQLERLLLALDIYAIINWFSQAFVVTFVVLALGRPVLRLRRLQRRS
jgi:hypothetical protein